jgi:hypothetical protein
MAGSGDLPETGNEEYSRGYGLNAYKDAGFKNHTGGNAFFSAAPQLEERENKLMLEWDVPSGVLDTFTELVTTALLGTTIVSEAIFENPDGSPYVLDRDYFGESRDRYRPMPGPVESVRNGKQTLNLW